MKTIFVSSTGELNEKGEGKIASLEDINFALCCGEESILGVLQLSEGIYTFFSNLNDKEAIEDVGEICEYIKISDIVLDESISEGIPLRFVC